MKKEGKTNGLELIIIKKKNILAWRTKMKDEELLYSPIFPKIKVCIRILKEAHNFLWEISSALLHRTS